MTLFVSLAAATAVRLWTPIVLPQNVLGLGEFAVVPDDKPGGARPLRSHGYPTRAYLGTWVPFVCLHLAALHCTPGQ